MHSLRMPSAAAATGLAVSAAAMAVAAWTLLQVMALPLGTVRAGWWPVAVAASLLLSSLLLPADAADGGRGAFGLRLSALCLAGLAPFWQGVSLSLRIVQQPVGFHRALCMLLAVAAFAVHNLLMSGRAAATAGMPRWARALCRLERVSWRLTGELYLETLAVCQLLVLFIQGEFRATAAPDALAQCLVGVGAVPKYTGWLFCVTCALSALSRLAQAVVAARTDASRSNDNGEQDGDDRGPGLPGGGAGDGAGGTAG